MYPGQEYDQVWRNLVFPETYRNPKPARRYNLVVIGAGPAGLVISIAAAGLGARVALIERQAMGGDCLNVGCVPSKSLLAISRRFAASGPEPSGEDQPETGFDRAFAYVREIRSQIAEHDSVERFSAAGVDVFLGAAHFVEPRLIEVDGAQLRTRKTVICTGARPTLPAIPGLTESNPLTNETLFDLRKQPERIAILGAGPIGCELAQALSRLGSKVYLYERADRPLPTEIPRAGKVLRKALQRDGVEQHYSRAVQSIEMRGHQRVIRDGIDEQTVDAVLAALGRQPNSDGLNLAAVGVDLDEQGAIEVNARLQTNNRHIYAAGDVCSAFQYTHNADAQARIVVRNALFAGRASTDDLIIPRCVYTSPEVAQLGANRDELGAAGRAFDVHHVDFSELDRARTDGDDEGFVEVLTPQGSDRVLGATLVGEPAGELVAPLAILMQQRLGLGVMQGIVLPYPTRSEFLRRLADGYNRSRLTPRVARLFKTWLRWRR